MSRAAAIVLALTMVAACSGPTRGSSHAGTRPSPAEVARADSGRPPVTPADIEFMSGMIAHHAQAVLIAGWAPTHDASPAIRRLCERIVVAQQDEIAFMQRWLRERRHPVPEANPHHHHMPGMAQPVLMPGMLSTAELTELDGARGAAFDRLFLQAMIRHHEGALVMIERLLGVGGAAQDEDVWKFVSDMSADQGTEIEFMGQMLAQLQQERRQQ